MSARALVIAATLGCILQVGMVVAAHTNKSVAAYTPVGGLGFSLLAGVVYVLIARSPSLSSAVAGGSAAGAICAFVGLAVAAAMDDASLKLVVLGTMSSTVTGLLGGLLGRLFAKAL